MATHGIDPQARGLAARTAALLDSTSSTIGVGSIELGHATDTTLARSSAGNMTIEGNLVYRAGGTDVPVADGGTGSSTAAAARTALAVVGTSDLAASTGAALVGSINAGTGATARTVQAKLRDAISVKDFGALGDGATNDKAAIQAAIDAAVALGGAKVYLPAGVYLFGSQITIGAGVTLVGDGPTDSVSVVAPTSLKRNYTTGAGILVTGDHSGFLDIGIDGNSNAGDLVQVTGSRFHARNTSVIRAGQDNLRIGDNDSGNTYNSNLWRLDRLICLNAGRYGVYVHDGKAAPDVNAGLAVGVDVAGCTNHGVYMERAWDTTLVNVVAQNNTGTGIRIGAASKNTVVYSPYTEANGNNELVIDAGALNTRVLGTRSGVSLSGYVDNGTGSEILQTRSGITGYYYNKMTIGGLGAGITAILDMYCGVNEINAGALIGRDGAVGSAGEVALKVKRNGNTPVDRLVLTDGVVYLPTGTELRAGTAAGNLYLDGRKYTPTLTPASVAAITSAAQTFTVTGLLTTDTVIVNGPAVNAGTGIVNARVSAADTLELTFGNFTAGALTPTSGIYRIVALAA